MTASHGCPRLNHNTVGASPEPPPVAFLKCVVKLSTTEPLVPDPFAKRNNVANETRVEEPVPLADATPNVVRKPTALSPVVAPPLPVADLIALYRSTTPSLLVPDADAVTNVVLRVVVALVPEPDAVALRARRRSVVFALVPTPDADAVRKCATDETTVEPPVPEAEAVRSFVTTRCAVDVPTPEALAVALNERLPSLYVAPLREYGMLELL